MAKNENLHAAKAAANDEFYTQYGDISNELSHYRKHFEGKTVYCNCDDPSWSNFWRYFHNNFASLKLKKLISTHYQKDSEPSYALIYEGGNDFDMDEGKRIVIHGNYSDDKKTFYTAGDFRSDACINLLKEADIVCSNPPFSLWRPYVGQLIEYNKQFLIIGNQNAITYKEVFPLIKDNKMWLGHGFKGNVAFFFAPHYTDYAKSSQHKEGLIRVSGVMWFTNLDLPKRHDGLWHQNGKFDNTKAHCYYEGFEDKYPKYDNYDAIEVSKTKDIPIDYPGVMGVPITWLDKYNPTEFEILGVTQRNDDPYKTKKYSKDEYPNANDLNARGVIIVNGKPKSMYARILIRNRNPITKKDDLGY